MAQFDVYPNPEPATRAAFPFVVDIQSNLMDGLATRLTLPLGDPAVMPSAAPRSLCPLLEVQGRSLRLLPHLAAAFRLRDLGRPVDTLHPASADIVAALDAVVSGV